MRDIEFYTPMDFSTPKTVEIHTDTIVEHHSIPLYFWIIQLVTLAIALLSLTHAV